MSQEEEVNYHKDRADKAEAELEKYYISNLVIKERVRNWRNFWRMSLRRRKQKYAS